MLQESPQLDSRQRISRHDKFDDFMPTPEELAPENVDFFAFHDRDFVQVDSNETQLTTRVAPSDYGSIQLRRIFLNLQMAS